jgi:hypothetical protein
MYVTRYIMRLVKCGKGFAFPTFSEGKYSFIPSKSARIWFSYRGREL